MSESAHHRLRSAHDAALGTAAQGPGVNAARWARFRGSVWPYAALSGSYFAYIGFFNPFLPLWLQSMGLSLATISVMVSLQSATRLYAPYLWGWLGDHTGRTEWLLRVAATGACLMSLALWASWSVPMLTALLIAMFTLTGAMMPMSEAALVKRLSSDGGFDARRYGRVRLWGSVGFLFTVTVAGAGFERSGMGAFAYWTTGILAVVAMVCWTIPSTHTPRGADSGGGLRGIFGISLLRWVYAQVFFHVLSHTAMYVFFSLYLDGLGYSKSTIGLMWAVSVMAEIVWFFTQSRWMASARVGTWLVVVSVVAAARFALLAGGAQWPWLLAATQLMHALTFAAHHTLCMGLITRACPPAWRGRAQALYTTIGYGLAAVLAGVVGGLVAQSMGLRWVFVLASVSAMLATAMAWRVRSLELPPTPGPQREA